MGVKAVRRLVVLGNCLCSLPRPFAGIVQLQLTKSHIGPQNTNFAPKILTRLTRHFRCFDIDCSVLKQCFAASGSAADELPIYQPLRYGEILEYISILNPLRHTALTRAIRPKNLKRFGCSIKHISCDLKGYSLSY